MISQREATTACWTMLPIELKYDILLSAMLLSTGKADPKESAMKPFPGAKRPRADDWKNWRELVSARGLALANRLATVATLLRVDWQTRKAMGWMLGKLLLETREAVEQLQKRRAVRQRIMRRAHVQVHQCDHTNSRCSWCRRLGRDCLAEMVLCERQLLKHDKGMKKLARGLKRMPRPLSPPKSTCSRCGLNFLLTLRSHILPSLAFPDEVLLLMAEQGLQRVLTCVFETSVLADKVQSKSDSTGSREPQREHTRLHGGCYDGVHQHRPPTFGVSTLSVPIALNAARGLLQCYQEQFFCTHIRESAHSSSGSRYREPKLPCTS